MKEALGRKFVPVYCFGAKIDLHRLTYCVCKGMKPVSEHTFRAFYCGDAFYDFDLREAIDVRLVPHAETVAVYDNVRVDLVIENRTDEVVPIVFAFKFMHELGHDVILVFNESGIDVTRKGAKGGGSRGREVLIALEPRGQAILDMKWWPATIVGEWSDDEGYSRLFHYPEWLPPGQYTLKFKVPFYFKDKITGEQLMPSATITVVP